MADIEAKMLQTQTLLVADKMVHYGMGGQPHRDAFSDSSASEEFLPYSITVMVAGGELVYGFGGFWER